MSATVGVVMVELYSHAIQSRRIPVITISRCSFTTSHNTPHLRPTPSRRTRLSRSPESDQRRRLSVLWLNRLSSTRRGSKCCHSVTIIRLRTSSYKKHLSSITYRTPKRPPWPQIWKNSSAPMKRRGKSVLVVRKRSDTSKAHLMSILWIRLQSTARIPNQSMHQILLRKKNPNRMPLTSSNSSHSKSTKFRPCRRE